MFRDSHQGLATAAADAGARVVWWQDDWWSDGRWPRPSGSVVFHGSLGNADRIRQRVAVESWSLLSTSRFACSAWWPRAEGHLVTPRYVLTTVADLVATGPPPEFGQRVFVRPDSALKPFGGRVLARDEITLGALDHGFYYDDESLPVVVAPEMEIGDEWRFVIVGATVVAGSDYTSEARAAGAPLSPEHPAWEIRGGPYFRGGVARSRLRLGCVRDRCGVAPPGVQPVQRGRPIRMRSAPHRRRSPSPAELATDGWRLCLSSARAPRIAACAGTPGAVRSR